jgi:hypothetical protein
MLTLHIVGERGYGWYKIRDGALEKEITRGSVMDFKSVARLAVGNALLLVLTVANAQTVVVQQFGVTAVNSNGDALYNVTVTPNTPHRDAEHTGEHRRPHHRYTDAQH